MSDKPQKPKVEVLDWSDLNLTPRLRSQGRLSELLNVCVEFDMATLEVSKWRDREVATILVRYGEKIERRHTFSEVVVKQLKAAKELFPEARITGKIVRRKNYYEITGCKEK
ncbi:MAG: hypothetical protein LM564_00175 [Desulfurococcaceae archaeon]|nr:hypothetical protein [Desulfurococcaceae archaeon]